MRFAFKAALQPDEGVAQLQICRLYYRITASLHEILKSISPKVSVSTVINFEQYAFVSVYIWQWEFK